MKKIKISKGYMSLVSNVDFQILSKYKWHYCKGHAKHNKLGFMHRFILERMIEGKIPKGIQGDHINRNGLDNQRSNLRLATHSQNIANQERKLGKSGFRGVRWDKRRNKWRADIQFEGRKIALGRSELPEECAKLYDKKAKELFKSFAFLNFP